MHTICHMRAPRSLSTPCSIGRSTQYMLLMRRAAALSRLAEDSPAHRIRVTRASCMYVQLNEAEQRYLRARSASTAAAESAAVHDVSLT